MHPGTGFELDYESFQFMIAAALTVVVNIEVGMYVCTFVFVCVWCGGVANLGVERGWLCNICATKLDPPFPPFQIALDTLLWTPITHLFILFSIVSYFFLTIFFSVETIYNAPLLGSVFQDVGVPSEVLSSSSFWFYCLLLIILCMFPVIFKRMLFTMLWPSLVDYIRYDIQHKRTKKLEETIQAELFPRKRKLSTLQEKRKVTVYAGGEEVIRTGFAFSGAEGGANLIMSGRAFNEQLVEDSRRRRSMLHSSYWTSEVEEMVVSPRLSRSASRQSLRSSHSEQANEWKHEEEDVDKAQPPSEGLQDSSQSGKGESPKSAESSV